LLSITDHEDTPSKIPSDVALPSEDWLLLQREFIDRSLALLRARKECIPTTPLVKEDAFDRSSRSVSAFSRSAEEHYASPGGCRRTGKIVPAGTPPAKLSSPKRPGGVTFAASPVPAGRLTSPLGSPLLPARTLPERSMTPLAVPEKPPAVVAEDGGSGGSRESDRNSSTASGQPPATVRSGAAPP